MPKLLRIGFRKSHLCLTDETDNVALNKYFLSKIFFSGRNLELYGANKLYKAGAMAKPPTQQRSSKFQNLQDLLIHYDNWAPKYDADALKTNYNAPKAMAEICAKYIPADSHIIDICAGTGLVGEVLHRVGYKRIDAHDGSAQMLEESKKKGCYNKFICEIFEPNLTCSINTGRYDGAVICGAFSPGHLNTEHLLDLIRIVKPGGKIIIGFREEWVQGPLEDSFNWPYDMPKKMSDLERQKKWKLLHQEKRVNYVSGKGGVYYVFEVLEDN